MLIRSRGKFKEHLVNIFRKVNWKIRENFKQLKAKF